MTTRRKARERVLDGLHRIYGGMPGIDDVPVSGTVDDVVAGLQEVIDAGAETILLNPVGGDVAEDREQMERLAAEVIPQLQLSQPSRRATRDPSTDDRIATRRRFSIESGFAV